MTLCHAFVTPVNHGKNQMQKTGAERVQLFCHNGKMPLHFYLQFCGQSSEVFFALFSDMEAECSDDVMKLRVKFNATFSGLIYSAGKQHQTPLCRDC